ncbi:MAG: hypothetical protein PHF24_05955 [Syntrophomonas sp.]|nr:hypothetical protein [Syntrophomonas sp.]
MLKSRNIVIFILIVFVFSLVGCSKDAAEKKPSSQGEQKPKAPTELKIMATELDMLITELDNKFKKQKLPAMQQSIKLNPQSKSTKGQTQSQPTQGGQSQDSQSSNGQSQDGKTQGSQNQDKQSQNGTTKDSQQQSNQTQNGKSQASQSQGGQSQSGANQKQAADWQKEFNSLKNIHSSWNKLMPDAVTAGMSIDSRQNFSDSLEKLTENISKQKLEESIASVLVLYKNFADLTQIFNSSVPAEYNQVKYEIMAAVFEACRLNWATAEQHVPKLREHWIYFSAQASGTDPQILNRTEFAIMDLEQAIKSKQMELVMIKGEIAMTNLKSLEEKLRNQTSNQSQ